MLSIATGLFSQVKHYLKLSQSIQADLLKSPYEWHKFQDDFNARLEKISSDLLQFEKNNLAKSESKVYKFKKIFQKRYRHYFLYGDLARWTFTKPFGYAGDFKIIDNIYRNVPETIGFDGLWDTYFLQMCASKATRERKDNLKKFISEFVESHKNKNINIMNLGSGSAREIKELLEADTPGIFSRVDFDCYDFDTNAINYAKQLLNSYSKVNFFQKNAIRLALKKDITQEIGNTYDLIYSAGLFDYLDERIAVRLISNLKRLLKKDGCLIIANFGDKYFNSSAGLMEWVTEWYLIYRTEEEFRKLFLESGFQNENLQIIHHQDKVVVYCLARAT